MKKFFIFAVLALLPFFAKSQNFCPDSNHPHAIDLGLPSGMKWACCNVGSSKPEDYGSYFAWGETSTKSYYSWKTYIWCNGSGTKLIKYNTQNSEGMIVDNKKKLDLEDDAARANWHGFWRIPTPDEHGELRLYCEESFVTINGVFGIMYTSHKNGRSIFLPAAGYKSSDQIFYRGELGRYWHSSLLNNWKPAFAQNYSFPYLGGGAGSSNERYEGQSVRPVFGK